MPIEVGNQVQIKLFAGVLITIDMRKHLNVCSTWKESLIGWQSEKGAWIELRYQNKHYFGKYLTGPTIPMPDLRLLEKELKNVFSTHCPELSQEQIKLTVFPQMFVA